MDWITTVTFDQIALSVIALALLRAGAVALLPDHIAGPGGWLVNTGSE
ncbi:hypothetical protein [Rhodovulum adriaticum]|uniref:Uncharacterized protein n=1 Tax=Rhodovulum adriaticum TaxID=35804 RepID=A0A4V6NQH6_RHOAD|nr:hypothetical protein [Rhodovulum adriaticum]TCP23166.1 hypothetical protein EV656_104137 [Rhodovulum adriaticum]